MFGGVAGPVVWCCAIQFACNAVNSHAENAALFWEEFCPAVRYMSSFCICIVFYFQLSTSILSLHVWFDTVTQHGTACGNYNSYYNSNSYYFK